MARVWPSCVRASTLRPRSLLAAQSSSTVSVTGASALPHHPRHRVEERVHRHTDADHLAWKVLQTDQSIPFSMIVAVVSNSIEK
jgi:hypothetical protein